MLDVGAKRRLVGAVVLVVLAVVFLPMFVEEDGVRKPVPEEEFRMPAPPPAERGRQAEIFPSIEETGPRPASRSDPALPRREPAAELAPAASADSELDHEPVPAVAEPDDLTPQPAGKPPVVASPKTESAKPKSGVDAASEKPKPVAPASPKPVPKGLTSWVVQVAALSTPEAAQGLEDDLRNKGFHAFVEKLEGSKRTLWRVRVGPEVERTRAEALATDVKKRTGLDAFVQKYRDG